MDLCWLVPPVVPEQPSWGARGLQSTSLEAPWMHVLEPPDDLMPFVVVHAPHALSMYSD